MKKKVCLSLCALLATIIAVGIINRQAGKNSQADPTQSALMEEQTLLEASTEQTISQPEVAKESTPAQVIIAEYPELRLSVNAQCPFAAEARQIPVIAAHVSEQYFEKLRQDLFLSRYPDATLESQEYEYAKDPTEESPVMIGVKTWYAEDETSNILSYITFEEDGTVDFEDLYMETDGKASDNSAEHRLVIDETGPYTGSFTQQQAENQAIKALEPYTDFDISLCDVQKTTYGNGYKVDFQLMYQETPISFPRQSSLSGGYLVSEEAGVSLICGIYPFGQIYEKENSSAMNLEDALAILEQNAPEQIPDGVAWNVYHIQMEYYGEYSGNNNPGMYTFRPTWAFYYTINDSYEDVFRFYADTGEICSS